MNERRIEVMWYTIGTVAAVVMGWCVFELLWIAASWVSG
jgi:hypothetical protein